MTQGHLTNHTTRVYNGKTELWDGHPDQCPIPHLHHTPCLPHEPEIQMQWISTE